MHNDREEVRSVKRFIALFLVFILSAGCAMAGGVGDALSDITLKVKEALQIGDEYSDFTGSNYDGRWDLYWSSDDGGLNVTCDGSGKIYHYYEYENYYEYDDDFTPRYPDIDTEEITAITEDFLSRVITGENEGWILGDVNASLMWSAEASVTIEGRLTVLDKPTDITLSITVNTAVGKVVSFYRSDNYREYSAFSGDMTDNIGDVKAREKLDFTVSMELVYLVIESGEMATPVYMPKDTTRYAVRASDGEVISLDTNEAYYATKGDYGVGMTDSVEEEAASAQLTEVELSGIGMYEGAMDQEQLDAYLRGITELGITEGYEVVYLNYYVSDGKLMASIGYNRVLSDDEAAARSTNPGSVDEKIITLNAVTGSIENLYTYQPGIRTVEPDYDTMELTEKAEAFVNNHYPEYADVLLNDGGWITSSTYSWERTLDINFVRTHNGIPFRNNYITLSVDCETGNICSIYSYWNNSQEFVEFEEADIIGEDAAHAVYLSGFEFEDAFMSVPGEMISEWDYISDLTYCWHYQNVEMYYAVNALTGEGLNNLNSDGSYEYTDIEGSEYEEAIATLGIYGIGFSGGGFGPDAPFTVKDGVLFICQSSNYYDDNFEPRGYDELISIAQNYGFDGFGDYPEDQVLTVCDFVSALLDMSGYDKAMQLTGIYGCSFADDAEIKEADYAAIAIAYGLGLISPDGEGNIDAYRPLTRGEAALIFHKLLSLK